MKSFIKSSIVGIGALVVSFAIGFLSQYKSYPAGNNLPPVEDLPLTGKEKLLNSLSSISSFEANANININTADNNIISVDFNGKGDASDLTDIKLNGDIDLKLNSLNVEAGMSYFNGTIFFDCLKNYFYLETDNILDFVNMIPSYGLSLELPLDISEFSISELEDSILSMDDKKQTPFGEYYYTYQYNDDLTLYIKTNENDEFTGIRTDTISYKGNIIKLDVDLIRKPAEQINLINPLSGEHALEYQNFSPVFTIFDDVMRLIKKDNGTVKIDVDLKKFDETETSDILSTSLNLSFDKSDKLYGLFGSIEENERTHDLLFAYQDSTLYANYHDVKASLSFGSIESALTYAMRKIGEEKVFDSLLAAVATMSNTDIMDIVNRIPNVLDDININEELFTIDLDPTVFEIDGLNKLTVALDFDNENLNSITIKDLNIMGYGGDIAISFVDYIPFEFDKDNYVEIDPAINMITGITDLINDTQFGIDFSLTLDKEDPSEADITFDGGLQFDIEDMFGYGEVAIVDGDGYTHDIKVDMKSPEEILFSYNGTMNGKFNTNTMRELIGLVEKVINEPDDHFKELFGGIIDTTIDMPIMDVVNGDIGAIFDTKIVKDIDVAETYLELTVYLDIVGMQDKTLTLRINYDDKKIDGIDLTAENLLDGTSIEFHGQLHPFDVNNKKGLLDPYEEYMDFSDIKVLLELGINTSKFNYFHFTSNVSLSIGTLLNNLIKIPLDVKIRNDHGDVQVEAHLKSVPTIPAINTNSEFLSTKSREAYIYYANDLISIKRVDTGHKNLIQFHDDTWTLIEVLEPDYFLENILPIMLQDILGLSDSMLSRIGNISTDSEAEQIHYEQLLKSFVYSENDSYFFFDINIAELAHSKQLSSLTLKVNCNNDELTGIDVNLSINVLITIKVELTLTLADKSEELLESNRITGLETFMKTYESMEHNTKSITLI